MAIRKLITGCILHQVRRSSVSVTYPPFANPKIRSLCIKQTPHQCNLISLSSIFQRHGFSPSQVPTFLEKNEFLLKLLPSDIEKSLNILHSLIPRQDFLLATVCDLPAVLELDFLEKWQLGIIQLGIPDISPMAASKVLEGARKFGLSPDDIFTRVKCLKGLGFSDNTIIRILEAVPIIIMSNEDEICSKVHFLMSLGILRTGINRIFSLFPGIMMFGVKNRLKPLLDEFEDLGLSLAEVRREVLWEPMVLGLELGEFTHCLEMLRSLKCRPAIKENIFRHGEFRAGYDVKLRVDCLRKHGLIYREAFCVLWKEPRIISYGIDDIEKKIEFLVQKMKFNIKCLVEVPEYLGVNFEKQILPRFQVIEYLRSKSALGDEVDLRNVIKLSRLRFYNRYVKPYPDCEKIYGRYVRESQVQCHHPVGMWKILRPQRYPKSDEDIKNVKSYMELLH